VAKFGLIVKCFLDCDPAYMNRLVLRALNCSSITEYGGLQLDTLKLAKHNAWKASQAQASDGIHVNSWPSKKSEQDERILYVITHFTATDEQVKDAKELIDHLKDADVM
jgi:hypothetical protein